MRRGVDGLRPLILGEDQRLAQATVVAAGVLFLTAMIVDYITLSSVVGGRDAGISSHLRMTFRLEDPFEGPMAPSTWVYGYLLVVGLAAVHASFNLGYLTSLLLALSPNVGTALWSIHGFEEYMVLTPAFVPERVLPAGPVVATLGFLIGVALRSIRQPPPAPDAPPPDVPSR